MEPASRPPMPLGVVAVLTFLAILGGFLLIRWIIGTIVFALQTVALLLVVAVAVFLYVRYRASR